MFAKRMHRAVKKIDQLVSDKPKSFEGPAEMTAAAALSKMARKKGAEALQLQVEVETEVQWKNLLKREGLIVVDVYASWAGPCASMCSLLKKVKLEINDDRLTLAIACSDNISDLQTFKDQSEPCWLFFGGGKPVKLVRGCNPPKLVATIKSEFEQEVLCMQGKARRNLISTCDQVTRRKKAEDDAMRLAQKLRDERDDKVEEVLEQVEEVKEPLADPETEDERKHMKLKEDMEEEETNTRLINAMKPYAIVAIQCFLLETGAVTEIRDALFGEFKVVQERLVTLTEEGVRRLFNIPKEIVDPTEPDPVEQGAEDECENEDEERSLAVEGEIETETMLSSQSLPPIPLTPQPADKANASNEASDDKPEDENGNTSVEVVQEEKPPEKIVKMIPIDVPNDIIGDTLVFLMECKEIRKIIDAEEDSEIKTTLYTTADDYIQKRVGPESYEEAIEEAPKSLVALYGQGSYQPGVWCPRLYDEKKYAIINFFPRFVTELLTPAGLPEPKYLVVVFPVEMAYDILDNEELQSHKKDVVAQSRTYIPTALAHQMIKSRSGLEGEKILLMKKLLSREVFVVSMNEKNKHLKEILLSFQPLHTSVDNYYGKIETAKLFRDLDLLIDEPPDQEKLERILSKMKPVNGSSSNGEGNGGSEDNGENRSACSAELVTEYIPDTVEKNLDFSEDNELNSAEESQGESPEESGERTYMGESENDSITALVTKVDDIESAT